MRRSHRHPQRLVTEEPFIVAAAVKGRPLATIGHRAAALLVDGLLFTLLATPCLIALSLGAMYLQTPSLARSLVAVATGRASGSMERAVAETLTLTARRQPSAVPERYAALAAEGDVESLAAALADDSIAVFADLSGRDPSYYDPSVNQLFLRRDILFGPLAGYFGYAALGLVYLTLTLRLGRGRTAGKWLFGIRVVRLDGRPLDLRDCFARAGGYAASISTAWMGFFDATRDPNRQAPHDRIVGTVVVREERRRAA